MKILNGTGNIPLENARQKAMAYYKAFKMDENNIYEAMEPSIESGEREKITDMLEKLVE